MIEKKKQINTCPDDADEELKRASALMMDPRNLLSMSVEIIEIRVKIWQSKEE